MQRVMSVLVLVVVGCGGGDGGNMPLTDAPGSSSDSGASADAPGPRFGLNVEWVDVPSVPGPVSASVTVTSARFYIDKLEVIGDGGALPETTADDYPLAWTATQQPFGIEFENAPPAIYSKVRLSIDKGPSNTPSFEIFGTTVINTTTENFHISSLKKADIEVTGYNVQLFVGSTATVGVYVDMSVALAGIPWATLPTPGGVRTLDDSNEPEIDELIENLADTFTNN